MTNKINYKEPSEEQLKAMQEFADISSKLLEIMLKWDSNLALQHATMKVNEGMMWFHAYILNGGNLKPVKEEEKSEQGCIAMLN